MLEEKLFLVNETLILYEVLFLKIKGLSYKVSLINNILYGICFVRSRYPILFDAHSVNYIFVLSCDNPTNTDVARGPVGISYSVIVLVSGENFAILFPPCSAK